MTQTRQTTHPSGRASSPNIIEYSEDTKSRRFRAEVSDSAMESVSQPLALFFGARLGKPADRNQRSPRKPDDDVIDGQVTEYRDDSYLGGETPKALPVGADLDVLKRIFRRTSDNKLKISDSRLKQENQRDFVKRLTVLFLLMHHLEGQEDVPRNDLNSILTDAKVYDGNARSWISNSDLLDQDGELLRLAVPGYDHARKVLNEYLDPQIESKWSTESKTRRRASKGRTNDAEGEVEEGNKARKSRRPRDESYTAKVRMLFESGFFADGRTGEEVRTALIQKGFTFELHRINQALVAMTKKNHFTRTQDASGKWIYKNN